MQNREQGQTWLRIEEIRACFTESWWNSFEDGWQWIGVRKYVLFYGGGVSKVSAQRFGAGQRAECRNILKKQENPKPL